MTSNKEEGFTSMNEIDRLLDYYQFSHDPFAPRTPGFKFFTPKRKPVLAELHHLARYSSQMLVVTGPEGSGKTLLRQALVASSNKESVQCVVLSARTAELWAYLWPCHRNASGLWRLVTR